MTSGRWPIAPTSTRAACRSVADRIFAVLDACAASNRALSLAELVEVTGLPKTTLHRTCWKLVELGALEGGVGGFSIGTRLFALGSLNPSLRRLRVAAMPSLHKLCTSTGGVASLAVPWYGQALVVEEVYPKGSKMPRMLGAALPIHCTAAGKALIAGLPAAERDAILGDGLLPAATWRTLVRADMLRRHLDVVARKGIAYSLEEWHLGICGVAAPVVANGEVQAAIGYVGLPEPDLVRRVGDVVQQAAQELAEELVRAQPGSMTKLVSVG